MGDFYLGNTQLGRLYLENTSINSVKSKPFTPQQIFGSDIFDIWTNPFAVAGGDTTGIIHGNIMTSYDLVNTSSAEFGGITYQKGNSQAARILISGFQGLSNTLDFTSSIWVASFGAIPTVNPGGAGSITSSFYDNYKTNIFSLWESSIDGINEAVLLANESDPRTVIYTTSSAVGTPSPIFTYQSTGDKVNATRPYYFQAYQVDLETQTRTLWIDSPTPVTSFSSSASPTLGWSIGITGPGQNAGRQFVETIAVIGKPTNEQIGQYMTYLEDHYSQKI